MRGLSFAGSRSKLGFLYGGTQAPGVATCVRARACSMRASTRHSIALYSSSQHTQAEGTGYPHGRGASVVP